MEFEEFLNGIHEQIESDFYRTLVSFIDYESPELTDYKYDHFGTGILVKRLDKNNNEHYFILTAHHVVEDAQGRISKKNIGINKEIRCYFPIQGHKQPTDKIRYAIINFEHISMRIINNKENDISFFEITDYILREKENINNDNFDMRFLTYENEIINDRVDDMNGLCFTFGLLPSTNSYSSFRKKPKIENFKFNWNMILSQRISLPEKIKNYFEYIKEPIFFAFDKQNLINRENIMLGNNVSDGNFPEFSGMSGSPFFTFSINNGKIQPLLTGILVQALPNPSNTSVLVASNLENIIYQIDNILN